ncbi:DUF2971 domain-containing protein [Streptomyces sp. NPDC008317]|uniref:DUF2971 domain-containing protein n=1 Tax=Streptomyces sp. NPDC008317 TaxID=3364827 RepID=UPI0036F08F3F
MPSSNPPASYRFIAVPDGAMDSSELEMFMAPRSETDDLYHYTNANVAMYNILASGTLRLSPFESTNDLWESRPLWPNLSSHHEDENWLDPQGNLHMDLWVDIDRSIRLHTKVACLTRDFALPDYVLNRDAARGWGHLSLWAHYGAGHAGICLRFDRQQLIKSFQEQTGAAALRFQGPVQYVSTQGVGPYGLDLGQIREFGADAAALAYAQENHASLFFRKYLDWKNEAEYRLVQLDQSLLPAYIDIRRALSGVLLGDAFPAGRHPALREALKAYPDVEVQQLKFQNRYLHRFPLTLEEETEVTPWTEPRRRGSLEERLGALREATTELKELREAAKLLAAEYLTAIEATITALYSELKSWPEVESGVSPHSLAVPEEQRARQPGVQGERVHYEAGFMCMVENLPKPSLTLVVAAAVQILDGHQLRLHAVVTTEQWKPDEGNIRAERWRAARTVSIEETNAALSTLLADLRAAVDAVRPTFDELRGHTPGEIG